MAFPVNETTSFASEPLGEPLAREDRSAVLGELRSYTAEQVYFLTRLQRLLQRRQEYVPEPLPDVWLLKALDKAIYADYLDCIALDLRAEASHLLAAAQQGTVKRAED